MHPKPGEMLAGPGTAGCRHCRQLCVPGSDWSISAPGGHQCDQCAAAALPSSNISRVHIQDFLLSLEAVSASPGSVFCALVPDISEPPPPASDLAMDFQPPYFPPPFSSSAAAVPGHAHSSDAVFPAHLQPDHYQHYAVSHQPQVIAMLIHYLCPGQPPVQRVLTRL